MLDMGFIHDIKKILALLPNKRQNLMFSATFAKEIRGLTRSLLHNPVEIEVTPPHATADTVQQWLYPVDKSRKSALLTELVTSNNWTQVLVFTRTKHGANRLAQFLEKKGVNAAAIHSDRSQGARSRALTQFKQGKIRVLVATDIAARGLDIEQLPQVVNFDLPNVPEDYVHRIGRTGRAGSSGVAYSLVCADEIKQLNDIERVVQQHITRQYIDGFEPDHEVPASSPVRKAHRPARAQKAGKVHKSRHGAGANPAAARKGQGNKRPGRGNSGSTRGRSGKSGPVSRSKGHPSGNH